DEDRITRCKAQAEFMHAFMVSLRGECKETESLRMSGDDVEGARTNGAGSTKNHDLLQGKSIHRFNAPATARSDRQTGAWRSGCRCDQGCRHDRAGLLRYP